MNIIFYLSVERCVLCLCCVISRFLQCDEHVPTAKHRVYFVYANVATQHIVQFSYLCIHNTIRHTTCRLDAFAVVYFFLLSLSVSCEFEAVVIVDLSISISQPVIDWRFAWNQYWFIAHVHSSVCSISDIHFFSYEHEVKLCLCLAQFHTKNSILLNKSTVLLFDW